MTMDERIENLMDLVMTALADNTRSSALKQASANRLGGRLTTELLADLAGDHLFDDNACIFGFTESEGWMLREYFQTHAANNSYAYVEELRGRYPGKFAEETAEFLSQANKRRTSTGLPVLITY